MKLELKHLAGYLPYGLKFDGKRNGWVNFDGSVKNLCPMDLDGRWEVIKPILRPLSDLTKEIEVNNEKFIPLEELNKDAITKYRIEIINSKIYLLADFHSGYNILSNNNPKNNLLKWQFDVYGLIDAGLAIDINTL